ncbi:MAG TPA: penicillin-binding protein activator, partial [Acetobacteraceae bacterium]|nr:penicillin-binding protein activator [Acetobacteraceae bacterium]
MMLASALALTSCAGEELEQPSTAAGFGNAPPAVSAPGRTSGPVALLLPLSGPGPLAAAAQAMENAAKLAFSAPGSPPLDVRDTGGTPQGAAAAASAAIAAGDGLILGPLTVGETSAVAPVAAKAQVNVLAFTNDGALAAPGLWPLGISPGEQVRRVASYAADQGRTKPAALLPSSPFGTLMGNALTAEAARLGEPPPDISYYGQSFGGLNQTVRSLTRFNSRGASIEAKIRAARAEDTQAGRLKAAKLSRQPIPPPPFDSLLIGATGEHLAEIGTLLPYYEAGPPQVLLMGPMLWAQDAKGMAAHDTLRGAIYAAPDPQARLAFVQRYQTAYGAPPPSVADVAFDAAAIAVLTSREGGYTTPVLTNPAGFTGTDGLLQLQPNGKVRRGLAVFRVEPGGPQ